MSIYSIKQPGGSGVQQWSSAIAVGKSLRDLYASQGDVTLTGANTVATLLDGPEKVVRFGNLVLGDGTTATSLTASSRCKGLTVICDSLTVKANASLNMTGKGARVLTNDDPFFPFVDFKIPNQILLSSDKVTQAQALAVIRQNGFAPWDQGTFQAIVAAMFGFNLSVSQAGTLAIMLLSGCGVGGAGKSSTYGVVGNVGSAGTNGGMGGGGTGGLASGGASVASLPGGKGSPYSGGSGSGPAYTNGSSNLCAYPLMSQYSGPGGKAGYAQYMTNSDYADTSLSIPGWYGGGGAGNLGGKSAGGGMDGGNGVGGKLVIICYGTVTVQSGGKIEANGMLGGADGGQGGGGGGGSGGGHISIITPTTGQLANSGTIQAAGGAGGSGVGGAGGASGGAGSVVTKTFTDMGWA
jgi:hypothetical protein